MNTQKAAMRKIATIQKEELSAQKIELSSLKELNITYNKKKLVNDLKMEFISQFHLNSN